MRIAILNITYNKKNFFISEFELTWDSELVNAGVYFLKLQSDDFAQTMKLIVTK